MARRTKVDDRVLVVLDSAVTMDHGSATYGDIVTADHPLADRLKCAAWSPPEILEGVDVVVAVDSFIANQIVVNRGDVFAADDPIVTAADGGFQPWQPPPVDAMESR